MVDLNSVYAGWKSGLLTFVVLVAGIIGLILNIFFIFVTSRSKFLRRPANLFLLNLAIVDIVGAVFWILPAIIASSTWRWLLGQNLCEFHGFIGMFCFSLNICTLTVISFEKFMKLVIPARHQDAFHSYKIILIVIITLWIVCVVLSFMPLIGWSQFEFYSYQLQCTANYVLSTSLLNFFLIVVLIFPTLASTVLYIILIIKVKALSKKNKDGKFVLQERKEAPGYSYAEQMKIQNAKFKINKPPSDIDKKKKTKKKKENGKSSVDKDEGYDSDKCFHSDTSGEEVSEEEYFRDYEEYHQTKQEKEIIKARKKIFTYKQHYFFMAITMALTMLIYVALWLPFYIISYIWVYHPNSVQETSYTLFSVITFFGLTYKPLIYLTNKQVRISYLRVFKCGKKKKKVYGGGGTATDETTMTETKTVKEVHHTEEVVETTTTTRTYSNEMAPTPEPTVAWEESRT